MTILKFPFFSISPESAGMAGTPGDYGQQMIETPVAAEAVNIELPAIQRDNLIDARAVGEQDEGRIGEVHRLIAILGDQPLDRFQIRRFDSDDLDAAFSHPSEKQQLGLRTQQMRDLDHHRPGRGKPAIEAAEETVGDLVKRVVYSKPGGKRPGINDRRTGHGALP